MDQEGNDAIRSDADIGAKEIEIKPEPMEEDEQKESSSAAANECPFLVGGYAGPSSLSQSQQQQQQQRCRQGIAAMDGQIPRQAGVIGGSASQVVQNAAGKQALLELMQTLRSPKTPEQQSKILHILKSNPPLMAAFIKHRQALAMPKQADQHASGYAGPSSLSQSQQQQQQQPYPPGIGGMDGQMPKQAVVIGGPAGQIGQNAVGKQGLQQLKEVLKSPNTPEQQNQILHVLRSNSPLIKLEMDQEGNDAIQPDADIGAKEINAGIKIEIKPEPMAEDEQKESSSGYNAPANPIEAQKISIQRCIESLVHAVQCKSASCQSVRCERMKRVVTHIKTCKRRTSGGCSICKQLVALCCHHARHCQENPCSVPFCFQIKRKLRQQQHQQRLQYAELLRRRMAVMTRGIRRTPSRTAGR